MSKECRVQTGMKSFLKFMPKKAIILVSNSNVKSCLKGLYNYERFLLKPPRLGLHRLAVLHADLNFSKKKKKRTFESWLCVPHTLETTDSATISPFTRQTFAILEALFGTVQSITQDVLWKHAASTRTPNIPECQNNTWASLYQLYKNPYF